MADPRFFHKQGPFTLSSLAKLTGAQIDDPADGEREISDVSPLDRAAGDHISFLDNPKYVESFVNSRGGACFIRERYIESAPEQMALLITDDPYRCYALTAQQFYPVYLITPGIATSLVDPSAKIGEGVSISPGAVIGPDVEIGRDSHIGSNAVIYSGVKIGEGVRIGALSSISHALIGNRVVIHRGVHIGQDGFGFAMSREGHIKVPQLGRVLVEDDVEIGSGTCIDRGTGPDTIIGQGAKIDNLVQIGHNVQIGKLAIIVAQTGIAGSTRIGDGAVLAGQSGISGHIKIGPGAKIAAKSGVMSDIPAGASYGGSPAVPVKDWHRQTIALARIARMKKKDEE